MNVGNKISEKPSIKLYPQYSSGDAMKHALTDDSMGYSDNPNLENPNPPPQTDTIAAECAATSEAFSTVSISVSTSVPVSADTDTVTEKKMTPEEALRRHEEKNDC